MPSRIPVDQIKIGMFVSDLDRPWIDTPFLIQGFLVEDDGQIAQLRRHCAHVTIDRQRSTSEHQEPPAAAKAILRDGVRDEPRVVVHEKPNPARGNGANRGAVRVAATTQSAPRAAAQADGVIIATNDAEFRPTESGRFVLTPRPRAEDALPPLVPEARRGGGGWAKGLIGALKSLMKGDRSSEAEERFDDAAHAPPPLAAREQPPPRPSFLPETVQLTYYADSVTTEEELAPATEAYRRTNEVLHRIAEDIRVGRTLALQEVEEVISDMVESMVRNPDALMWVMRLRAHDSTLYGHGLYAAVYLVALGRHLGFPKDYLARLGTIGMLLDIGKIKLPRELLEKKGSLTNAEYETIKTHVQLGLDSLRETPNLHPEILEGIAQHHERENGSGYPLGLKDSQISIFGRMAAIADSFAALTNQRPYAEAVSAYDALRSLSGWGGEYFHGPMVEQFIQAVGVFPVGSLVELSSGEIAVVISHNKTRRLKPKVLVVTGPDKTPSTHPASLDLLYAPAHGGEPAIHIRRGLASGAYGLDASEFYVG